MQWPVCSLSPSPLQAHGPSFLHAGHSPSLRACVLNLKVKGTLFQPHFPASGPLGLWGDFSGPGVSAHCMLALDLVFNVWTALLLNILILFCPGDMLTMWLIDFLCLL